MSFAQPNAISNNSLQISTMPSDLKSWQLGLICGLGVFFLLIFTILCGYFYRRYTRSKRMTLSQINLYTGKTGIPHGEVFQQIRTLSQPRKNNHTAISWIHGGSGTTTNTAPNDRNHIVFRPSQLNNQVLNVDHMKVSPSSFSSNPCQKSTTSIYTPTNSPNKTTVSNVILSSRIFRTVSGTSIIQFGSRNDERQETKLRQLESVSLDRFVLQSSKKRSFSSSVQFTNPSFIDDNLNDEDAWMSILDVVNAELAKLDEQDRIRTLL